jgi:pilus assembly protein Flp/PilA
MLSTSLTQGERRSTKDKLVTGRRSDLVTVTGLCFSPFRIGEISMAKFVASVKKFVSGEEGATMVEYGLMLALIAVICLTAVTTVGTGAKSMFTSVGASL